MKKSQNEDTKPYPTQIRVPISDRTFGDWPMPARTQFLQLWQNTDIADCLYDHFKEENHNSVDRVRVQLLVILKANDSTSVS